MGLAAIAVVAAFPVVIALALWSSYHTVSEGEVEVLLVVGDARQILEPGPYFVPPFVSASYPVDLETMEYETPSGRRSIPAEFRNDLETIAGS